MKAQTIIREVVAFIPPNTPGIFMIISARTFLDIVLQTR